MVHNIRNILIRCPDKSARLSGVAGVTQYQCSDISLNVTATWSTFRCCCFRQFTQTTNCKCTTLTLNMDHNDVTAIHTLHHCHATEIHVIHQPCVQSCIQDKKFQECVGLNVPEVPHSLPPVAFLI